MSGPSQIPTKAPSAWAAPSLIAVIFINMLGFGIVVPLLPFYAKSFGAPPWQIAILFSAYSLGSFFGEPFWGRLSDRIGRKPVLIWTIAANCACYLAMAFAPNVLIAFIVRFLGGLCAGNGSVIQGYIADVTPPDERAGKMAMMGAAWNVGLIVGPSLGGLFAHPEAGPIGFRIPLLIASGLGGACAIAIAIFVRESRQREEVQAYRPHRWAAFGEAFSNPVIGRVMLLNFLVGFAFTGIEANFGLWTQARFDWGPQEIGLCFAVTGIVASITQFLLTGRLSKRFGEGNMLAFGMAVTAVCAFLQPFSTGGVMTVVLMAFSATGSSLAFPNAGALISRAADPHRQGQIMGLNNAMGAMARVTGPFFLSLTMTGLTINGPFFMAALVTAPAIFLALGAHAAAKRLPPQASE